jgi:protein ImuB
MQAMEMAPMLWIGLYLPTLSLEAFAATLPPPQRASPVALVDAFHVISANAAARQRGVQPGLKRATALALAPDLLLGMAQAARDAEALAAVVQAALAFTPSVAIEPEPKQGQEGPPHGLVLEVQSCLRYFGGLPSLLKRLDAALAPLGHRRRIACAPTALGAMLLARWRSGLHQGAHVSDQRALQALLDEAPLQLLGPAREHWDLMQGMGLASLGDLRRLPRSGLARRFGEVLLDDLDRALGQRADPRRWEQLPPVFESRLELFTRADSAEQVLAAAQVLLARLVAWSQAQHARPTRFTLRMLHEPRHRAGDGPLHTELEVALAQASCDATHLGALLRERLQQVQLAAPTLELRLSCSELVRSAPPSGELFPTQRSEREGLVQLLERLQARLGREQVQRVVLSADHRPEQANRLAPAAAEGPFSADVGADAAELPPRPLWLLPESQPLAVRELQVLWGGRPLQMLAGPERIEAGWWDVEQPAALRDYFIALAADGSLLWVYRLRLPDGKGSGWFLQGRFG